MAFAGVEKNKIILTLLSDTEYQLEVDINGDTPVITLKLTHGTSY